MSKQTKKLKLNNNINIFTKIVKITLGYALLINHCVIGSFKVGSVSKISKKTIENKDQNTIDEVTFFCLVIL